MSGIVVTHRAREEIWRRPEIERDIVRQVGSEDHITKLFKISGYQNPVFFCFS